MLQLLLRFIFIAAMGSRALGGGISEIIVFGDSLSDTGNVNEATFGLVPSPAYFESRAFSNGAPWVRFLAEGIGVDEPQHSLSGMGDRGDELRLWRRRVG